MGFNRRRDNTIDELNDIDSEAEGLVQQITALGARVDTLQALVQADADSDFEPSDIGTVNQRSASMKASIVQAAAAI